MDRYFGATLCPSKVGAKEPVNDTHEGDGNLGGQKSLETPFNIVGKAEVNKVINVEPDHNRFIRRGDGMVWQCGDPEEEAGVMG